MLRRHAVFLPGILLGILACARPWLESSMAGLVVQAFFLLNTVWMTATVGLLYQEAPQQLCSVYLSDEQSTAGIGMVLLAVAMLTLWLWRVLQKLTASA